MKLQSRQLWMPLALGLVAGFCFYGIGVPVLDGLTLLACAVPLTVVAHFGGTTAGVVGLAVGTTTVALLDAPLTSVFFLCSFGFSGLVIGLASRRRTAAETFWAGVTTAIVGMVFLSFLVYRLTGQSPVVITMTHYATLMGVLPVGMTGGEAFRAAVAQMMTVLPTVFPSVIVLASGLMSACTYGGALVALRRTTAPMPMLPRFTEMRLPVSVLWAYLFSLLVLLIPKSLPQLQRLLFMTGVNLELLIRTLLMLQGASVVAWFGDYKNVSRWVVAPAVVLLLVVPLLGQLAVMLGIVDLWLDVRQRYGGAKR